MPNWSFIRRLISSSGNIFARFVLGIPVHDCTGGFRCYRSQVLKCVDLDTIQSRGYAFQVELTYRVLRQGFKIVETPITFMDRRLGKSKMSRKIVIEAFMYVLRTRFSKQTFTPNTSISLEFAAAEFHPHSATSSTSPTIVPVTYLPINTPVIAMQNERSYGRSISTTQVKERTSLPITPLPESKPLRGIRSIKLESLE